MFGKKKGAPIGNQNAKGGHSLGTGRQLPSSAVAPRPGSRMASIYQGATNNSFTHASDTAFAGRRVHSGAHAVGGALGSGTRILPLASVAAIGVGIQSGNKDEALGVLATGMALGAGYGAIKQYSKSKAGKTASKFR